MDKKSIDGEKKETSWWKSISGMLTALAALIAAVAALIGSFPQETPSLPTNPVVEINEKLPCSTKSQKICSKNEATCEAIKSIDGNTTDLCRWEFVAEKNECENQGGIWTLKDSRFAKRFPGTVRSGELAVCATQTANLKK